MILNYVSKKMMEHEIKKITGTSVTGTLSAGSTSITLSNSAITTSSEIDIYTSIYGVSPESVTLAAGKITLTFITQKTSMTVKVVVK